MSEKDTELNEKYSDESFWEKMKNFAKKAGCKVVYAALLLYFALQNPQTPAWAKTVIIGALAYFISPIDAIPDVTPIVGFSDDLGALAAALGVVAVFIDEEVKEKARAKLSDWFGTDSLDDIADIDEKMGK